MFGDGFQTKFEAEADNASAENAAETRDITDALKNITSDELEEILDDIWETMDDMARDNGITDQISAGFRRGVKRRLAKKNVDSETAARIAEKYLAEKRSEYA